jgi:glycosyltransferase involved in cell wall biosynthesis
MHWTYPVPLYVPGWHNIYTVHDVIPLSDPGLTPIEPKRYRRILRSILARASAIVTVSDASCRQIAEHLGPLPVRVVNCRQAIDVSVDVQDALPGGLQDGQYMLVCGSVEPRKNIARLISAYRASGIAMPLVLAGPDGWRADMLSAQLGDTPGIVRLPSSTRAQMMTLIRHARALLMPSLAEGFGLPVAEAMALGTAVLTSARGALAETAGTAALLVEPESEEAISTGIRRLAHDEELVSDLAAQGRQRALALGLSEFASRLARLYADVVADAPHLTYRPPSWNEEQACGASQ